MSEASAVTSTNMNWVQQAQNNPVDFLKSLDDLLENFGPEELANAMTQQFLGRFVEGLRGMINDSELPQGIKDAANAKLDAFLSGCSEEHSCSEEASEAVSCCSESSAIDEAADTAVEDVSASARSSAIASERTESAGGASGVGHDGMDEINNEQARNSSEDKDGPNGPSWLEVLAGTLSDIQAKFLETAIKQSEIMADEADKITAEGGEGAGKSKAFLDAQAQYTATMQLFTIFSNQTSTSIKSVGEALAGIARKQ